MKLAAVFNGGTPDPCELLDSMLKIQRRRSWHEAVTLFCSQRTALGYVRSSDRYASTTLVRQSIAGNLLAISGLPISLTDGLDRRLDEIVGLDLNAALGALQQLEGAFAALFWHAAEQKLGIVTDILGMQPLYMYCSRGLVLIATEIKAITATGVVEQKMDPAGWGAFLSFRHPIGAETLVDSVRALPAGATMTYDPAADHLTTSTYWKWPQPAVTQKTVNDVPLDDLAEVFLAELEHYHHHNQQAWLCLSGGFDSRLILAALSQRGVTPETFSLSHADEMFDLDAKIAARVAREFGAAFTRRSPDRGFFSSPAYVDYTVCNEVATPSLYLFIAQLSTVLEPGMQAIWEGVFPGCFLYPVHQPAGGFEPYLRRECAPLDSNSWKAAALVFSRSRLAELREAFATSLAKEKNKYPDDSFGVSEFIVRNRTRRRIAINPLQVYCNDVLPLTPGLSKSFVSMAATIPYELRADHKLYQRMFQRFFPRALNVPAVSGTTTYDLNSRLDLDVLLGKLGLSIARSARVSAVAGKLGIRQGGTFWQESSLVDAAVRAVDPGHDDLNAEDVRKVQAAQPPYPPIIRAARELLFYWHSWRLMSGALQMSQR